MTENETPITVSIGESYGSRVGNLTIENTRFFGRPNFAGEMDRFKSNKRQCTVIVPNEVADQLRSLGWNVKTTEPQTEDQEPISHLKVVSDFRFDQNHPGDVDYEKGPDVWVFQGETREKLTSKTVGMLDRSRLESFDLEVRGWEYDPDDNPGALSARLVQAVATIRPSILAAKYGTLM